MSALVLFMSFSLTVFAQTAVTGKVTNSKNGAPVAGVTVTVKGTNTSTQTADDGTYSISAPSSNSILVFTSVGFTTQEVAASRAGNVSFVETAQRLDDVVVVAYGTRKKSDLTGAVTAIGTKDFQKGNIASSEQLLVGKVSGLEVTSGGGSAGGGSKIRIRTGTSLAASNDPLIVIDGVPVDGNGIAGTDNLLGTINPNDIESMSVLKDASATALYGSRASAGVIIVTTKKGAGKRLQLNYNNRFSLSELVDKVDVLTGDQIRSIVNANGDQNYISKLGTANTDWQDLIYRKAKTMEHNLSASGVLPLCKTFDLPARISLGILNQQGILRNNSYNRVSSSLNLSPKFLNDHLSVNVALKYSHVKDFRANDGAIGSAISYDPTQSPYNTTGRWGGYTEWESYNNQTLRYEPTPLSTRNPLGILNLRERIGYIDRMIGNVQLDYKLHFFPDLHVLVNLGTDNTSGRDTINISGVAASNFATWGFRSNFKQKAINNLTDVQLLYAKNISDKTKFDLLVGHSYQTFKTTNYYFQDKGGNGNVNPTAAPPRFPTDVFENRLESYLGRVNLTLADKYLLTASIRRDASSKFAEDYRVGYFPSVALAWKLKEEFFANNNAINELKLRASWGQTGQQNGIGLYDYNPIYSLSTASAQYQFGNTFYQFLRPGAYIPDRRWETNETINLGLDFGFAKNRIFGSIEAFRKKSYDLLNPAAQVPGVNFDITAVKNIGNMEVNGVEANLNFVPVRNKTLTWEFGVNGTYNKAKITKLLESNDPNYIQLVGGISGGTGNRINAYKVGEPVGAFYVFKQVYDNAGKPIDGLYEDINRDGSIDDDDRYIYQQPAPDFLFGLNTQVTIKKFSVGITGHGMAGNYLYNNYFSGASTIRDIKNPIQIINNVSTNYLETGFTNSRYLSDYYIENASFFRIDNVNIGYNFGSVSKGIRNLRLTANVQNVALFTKYRGLDPENAGAFGVDNNIYPRPRTYSVGANIDF
ncbi:MAG: SusC/RagA family TonB-linked outer membrane protein [Ferruginibacter sp.]